MMPLRVAAARLRGLFNRRAREQRLAAEVADHLEALTAEYRARGMCPRDAALAARRQFGGVDQIIEVHRDQASVPWLEGWWQEAL